MNTLRSIGAVAAGFMAVAVLSVATDQVLEHLGVFPPASQPAAYMNWMLLLALGYRTVFTVGGGWITAGLAPKRPMVHAVILGIVGLIMGTLGAIVNWDKTLPGTAWYPIALAGLALPSVWLGAVLRMKKNQRLGIRPAGT
jgi:hypothetical protein